jgi:hypothetical protein
MTETTAAAPLTPSELALRDLLGTVASDIRRGVASPDVRAAYTTWMEAKR